MIVIRYCMYIYIYICISLSLYIYIYIYTHMSLSVSLSLSLSLYVYIYIYIRIMNIIIHIMNVYIHVYNVMLSVRYILKYYIWSKVSLSPSPNAVARAHAAALAGHRKGANGVSTNGVTADVSFFDRDLLGTPVNLLLSSQKCQCVPFSSIRRNSLLSRRPH